MASHFKEQYDQYLQAIENYLQSCFAADVPQKALFESMRYSLLAGGKRLRPIFVLDFCRMCGGNWHLAIPFAAAVEMIHTYSLIHDDLPCMDDDDLRRGKPTNHKVFGEAMAVLAGDALLTSAFMQISNASLPADVRIKAVNVLSECAGELGMVGGQALDINSEERECTHDDVMQIQSRKTGALIIAACVLGVLAGGGSLQQQETASSFAAQLGLAFQIRDDVLDVIGDSNSLGKAVGVDCKKNTLVQLYGVTRCSQLVHDLTAQAKAILSVGFSDTIFMCELADWLTGRNF